MWGTQPTTYTEPSPIKGILTSGLGLIIALSIFLFIIWLRLKLVIWIISKIVIGVRENVAEHDRQVALDKRD